MSGIAIDVEGLTKSFGGRVVVRDLTLKVPRGSIFGFLGPNGSGKTTTIRMLCGLLTPDAGSGTCLGHDILTEADLIKRQVGYMTQRFSLYEDLSIRENLEFVSRVYGVPGPRQAANDGRSDNQPVRHRRQAPDVLGTADPKPDAEGQGGLLAKPRDFFEQLGGQLGPLARDARDGHIVQKARR